MSEVDRLERVEADLLGRGRAIFGVTGAFEYGPLGDALRASESSLRPAVALAAVAGVTWLPAISVWLESDAMSRSFGGYGAQVQLIVAATFAAGMALGSWKAERLPRRIGPGVAAMVCGAGLVGAALGTLYVLLLWFTVAAVAGGMAQAVVLPRLYDSYPPEVRARVTAILAGGVVTAYVVSAGALAASETLGLSWRAVLLALGMTSITAGAAAGRTPLASPGAWDEQLLADEAHRAEGGVGEHAPPAGIEIGLGEQFRRVLLAPTTAPLLLVAFVFGLVAVPGQRYASVLLRNNASVPAITSQYLSAIAWTGGLVGLIYIGRRAEIAYRASPARLLQLLSWLGAFAAAAVAVVAVSDNRALATGALSLTMAVLSAQLAGALFALGSLTPPQRRAHAAVLMSGALLVGAQFGMFVLDAIGTRFGAAWGLVTAAAVALATARRVNRGIPSAEHDLDAVVTSIVEEESLRAVVSQGKHVPLLACRDIDFSYGQLQVLFGVDFTVDDGEMVALLGTNGAGKSTLLRVVSGLGLPSSGTVRLRGADISFVGTDRRVQMGISQIPGGKAVFGPMTVAENLAVYGFTHGRDKETVARGVDTTFEAFPRLAERRNQLASTLSGGEQQMLALGKAFILRPQLLLIDELSLGLAPIIVSDLLTMVRQINAAGTAVVLVEQSVNIALSLVQHAYFMEKGEIRFNGRAAELIERPDLLRSVFLEGVARAVTEPVR